MLKLNYDRGSQLEKLAHELHWKYSLEADEWSLVEEATIKHRELKKLCFLLIIYYLQNYIYLPKDLSLFILF